LGTLQWHIRHRPFPGRIAPYEWAPGRTCRRRFHVGRCASEALAWRTRRRLRIDCRPVRVSHKCGRRRGLWRPRVAAPSTPMAETGCRIRSLPLVKRPRSRVFGPARDRPDRSQGVGGQGALRPVIVGCAIMRRTLMRKRGRMCAAAIRRPVRTQALLQRIFTPLALTPPRGGAISLGKSELRFVPQLSLHTRSIDVIFRAGGATLSVAGEWLDQTESALLMRAREQLERLFYGELQLSTCPFHRPALRTTGFWHALMRCSVAARCPQLPLDRRSCRRQCAIVSGRNTATPFHYIPASHGRCLDPLGGYSAAMGCRPSAGCSIWQIRTNPALTVFAQRRTSR